MTHPDDHPKARRPHWVPGVLVSMVSAYFVFAVFVVLWFAEPARYSAQEISDAINATELTCFVVQSSVNPPREIVDCYDHPTTDPEAIDRSPSIGVIVMLDARMQEQYAKDPCWGRNEAMWNWTRLWEDGQNWIGFVFDPRWTNDLARAVGGEVITCPDEVFE
jgi:hypothetical protein